jgi:hypothetical protein
LEFAMADEQTQAIQHTAGEWRIGACGLEDGWVGVYAVEASELICQVVAQELEGECEANARLIAAAPLLLEACSALLGAAVNDDMEPGIGSIEIAARAIRMAMGGDCGPTDQGNTQGR